MGHAGERDALAQVKIASEEPFVTFMAVHWALGLLLHQALKLRDEALVPFLVVRFVLKNDVPIAVERDTVVWVRQGPPM